jgi:hypothetical protein
MLYTLKYTSGINIKVTGRGHDPHAERGDHESQQERQNHEGCAEGGSGASLKGELGHYYDEQEFEHCSVLILLKVICILPVEVANLT